MPKVRDVNTGEEKASFGYDAEGVNSAEKLAASDPSLEVVNEKHPLQSYAMGGPVKVKTRGTGAAERGLDFWEGCSSRPRR